LSDSNTGRGLGYLNAQEVFKGAQIFGVKLVREIVLKTSNTRDIITSDYDIININHQIDTTAR